MSSQVREIRKTLESGVPITALYALQKFGCMRLASRIHDLKTMGVPVKSRTIHKGKKRFSEYYLEVDNA